MTLGVQIAALAVAAIGTGVGIHQQQKAEKSREDADKAAQAQAELANQRSIRQSIAQSRLQQANLLAGAESQLGGASSSAVTGALGAARTQQASNIGFAQSTLASGAAINDATKSFNRATSAAQTAGALAALPSQFGFTPAGSAENISKNFADKTFSQNFWQWGNS